MAKVQTGRESGEGLREARRRLAEGRELSTSRLPDWLQSSWQRSREFGLAPLGRNAGVPYASSIQLARMLDHERQLVSHAKPVMEYVCEQIRGSDSIVMLADPGGMLLCSMGDDSFAARAARVALRPGASWHEQWRGTNAIGTAIADQRPMAVIGSEHFLARNGFLSCSAAPIFDSAGRLLGVIDISGHRTRHHPHTLGLARSAARLIEHRMFDVQHAHDLKLRLHPSPEGIGTMTEGLLAISDDGRVIGADGFAIMLLGLQGGQIGSARVDEVLGASLTELENSARSAPLLLQPPNRADGGMIYGCFQQSRRGAGTGLSVVAPLPLRIPPPDALSALDLGDAGVKAIIARARRVIDKPIPLLVLGESGVGKEVFARACHQVSARAEHPFVAVNCAALPGTLIESELFGYRAGAFTGAQREGRIGRIREAEGGTLFLDEIGDMPLALQTHLLRVLQERRVVPLGGGSSVAVDFQLVCATNRDLQEEVEAGRFRRDLFHRVNGLVLRLPPLRERTDLGLLIRRMLDAISPDERVELRPDAWAALQRYAWPGNLRQLDNVLRVAVALLDRGETFISLALLPDEISTGQAGGAAVRSGDGDDVDLKSMTERSIRHTLDSCGGNVSEAARRLGVSRSTLYRRLHNGSKA